MDIRNKNITILGAERSGIGAAKLVKKLGGNPFVSDFASEEKLAGSAEQLREAGIPYECGLHSEKVYAADFIIISPGVPSHAPVVAEAKRRGVKIISEIEFASFYCKGKVIAITGTNGKTTTTTLIAHLINASGYKCYTAGNIGLAFSDIALDVKENEFVALEVSSFQLDYSFTFKPAVSMILNITPDHLNRYENSFEKYIESKYRMFQSLTGAEVLILNGDDRHLVREKIKTEASVKYFSLLTEADARLADGIIRMKSGDGEFAYKANDLFLRGEHNYANVMASILAVTSAGVQFEQIRPHLATFKGVEHRLELVAEIDGVRYINDSKATNVDSVWFALRSFDEPLYLILGGQDKGNNYDQIRDLVLEKVKKIFAIGSSADKVYSYFHRDVKVEVKNSLEECISAANLEARDGEVVLLSPACASFDMFDNYEHRGRVFKDAVRKLIG